MVSAAKPGGALSENIALLAQFGEAIKNPTKQVPTPRFARVTHGSISPSLSLREEQRLAEAFSLLLATSIDNNVIGALCIEERLDQTGFVVRTAVNSGTQDARKKTFRRLISAAKLSLKPGQKDVLLHEIVLTSQLRLLGRLRSKHAPSSNRCKGPPIITQLQKALQRASKNEIGKVDFEILRDVITTISNLFADLEQLPKSAASSEPGRLILKNLLTTIKSRVDFTVMLRVLTGIAPKDFPWPGMPCHQVLRKFQKLTQYISAGRYVRQAVRKYPTWTIDEVHVGPYSEQPNGAEPDGAAGLLSSIFADGTHSRQKNFKKELESRLGRKIEQIKKDVKSNTKLDRRVHAEIQLIYHYAQNPKAALSPRVICSNKEACYLCNLYIDIHGGFITPRSHGRLYPRWRLPNFDEIHLTKSSAVVLRQAMNRFNKAIEDEILLRLSEGKSRIQPPSESTLFGTATCVSSNSSTLPDNPVAISRRDAVGFGLCGSESSSNSGADSINEEIKHIPNSTIERTTSDNVGSAVDVVVTRSDSSGTEREVSLAVASEKTISTARESDFLALSHIAVAEHRNQSHVLSIGQVIKARVLSGSSVTLRSPYVHFEFIYKASGTTKSTNFAPGKNCAELHVEWLSLNNRPDQSNECQYIDLEAIESFEHPCDGILTENGAIIYGRGCTFRLQVSSTSLEG